MHGIDGDLEKGTRRILMHRLITFALAMVIAGRANAASPEAFDRYFTAKSLRIDLFHTGDGDREIYSLDEMRAEGR